MLIWISEACDDISTCELVDQSGIANSKMDMKVFVAVSGGEKVAYERIPNLDATCVNKPELMEGMIPVYYDAGEWKIANKTNSEIDALWYNYGESRWANAVVVNTTKYNDRSSGTVVSQEDILGYYVWVPRFKYRLWNATATIDDTYDAYNKGIDIVFENRTESSGVINCQNNVCYSDELLLTKVTEQDNGKYYTHPAFSNNGEDLTGLWVSKYEVTTNSEKCNNDNIAGCTSTSLKIESIPGNAVWRNNYLSYFYQTIKKLDMDNNYHVIKNSEWGAITYLTHSKYGLCQNEKCNTIGTNKTYISGNDLDDSTTKNMYGIFDMSGSASEFVMANFADANNNLTLANTHFESTPLVNGDYDLYPKDTFILGDATKEISLSNGMSWYNSQANFINETSNWFIRGGNGATDNTGIFNYSQTTDAPSEYISTRIVAKG